jgi:Tol biopolymer transport system component
LRTGPTEPSLSSAPKSLGLGDGELIVFERLRAGTDARELDAVGPAGGKPLLVTHDGQNPHWSPDGTTLAFLTCLNPPRCTTAVALMDRATGAVHGFSMSEPNLYTPCSVWAPTGRLLACEGQSQGEPRRNGIYTIRANDGKGLTRITINPNGVDSPLAYSPEGHRLLFNRTDSSRPEASNAALFLTNADRGHPTRVTPWGYADDYASWSPDGKTIVFGTNGSLYTVTPDGTGPARIHLARAPDGSFPVNAFDVSFSPDGRRLLFSLTTTTSTNASLYTALLDGSNLTRLTTSPTGDHHATWGPAAGA